MGVQTSSTQSGTTCSYNFESIAAMQSAFRKEVTSAINTLNAQNTQLSEAIQQMSQKLTALSEQDGTVKSSWTDEDGTLHEELYDHSAEMTDLTDQIADAQAALDANLTQIGELNATLEDTETFINNLCQQVMETDEDFANKIKELQGQVDDFVKEMNGKLDTIKKSINTNYADYVKAVTDYYASDLGKNVMGPFPYKRITEPIAAPNIGKVKTALENMGLNIKTSGIKQTFQERFYQDYYEDLYAPDGIDNLFFITDMRLKGLDEIFLDKQINASINLYTLADNFPEYYKLSSKSDLASNDYINKLEEARKKILSSILPEDIPTLMAGLGPDSIMRNTLLNALVEQSIYEIKANSSISSSTSDEQWYAFTSQINKVVISSPTNTLSEIMNYGRNEFNRAPATWEELLKETDKWVIMPAGESRYHIMNGEYDNIKLVSKGDGRYEVVYDKNGNLVTNINQGTYNYSSHVTGFLEAINHGLYDIIPYYAWGVMPNDGLDIWQRGNGGDISESEKSTIRSEKVAQFENA